MRQVLLGVAAGLSLALAILGPQGSGVSGTELSQHGGFARAVDLQPASGPQSTQQRLVAAHADSNTEEVRAAPNGNLIAGTSTIVCVGEAQLKVRLREAVGAWNTTLKGLGFSVFDLQERSSTAECVRLSGVHVVVRAGDCPNNGACYMKLPPGAGELPRQTFRRTGKAFAEIEYESAVVRKSTLMHELGHVLGLSDYKSCDGLRQQGVAAVDPDPTDQHYSLMYNASDRECRPQDEAMITGRDLRDLYERAARPPPAQTGPCGPPRASRAG